MEALRRRRQLLLFKKKLLLMQMIKEQKKGENASEEFASSWDEPDDSSGTSAMSALKKRQNAIGRAGRTRIMQRDHVAGSKKLNRGGGGGVRPAGINSKLPVGQRELPEPVIAGTTTELEEAEQDRDIDINEQKLSTDKRRKRCTGSRKLSKIKDDGESSLRRSRRWRVHPSLRNRGEEGVYQMLMRFKQNNDVAAFQKHTLMTPALFDKLEHLIGDKVKKIHHSQDVLEPGLRLATTIRYITTGDNFVQIASAFRVGKSTARKIALETCAALWDILQPLYMPIPTHGIWKKSGVQFGRLWQFPNCCGAIRTKQIIIQRFGNRYGNKESKQVVNLLAVVGPSYQFLTTEIYLEGAPADGGTMSRLSSIIGHSFEQSTSALLPEAETMLPHVLLANESELQSGKRILTPYIGQQLDNAQHLFNYRHSSARCCSENAFGIMAARFRVFSRPVVLKCESVDILVKGAVVLHNFLLEEEQHLPAAERAYCPLEFADYFDHTGSLVRGRWHGQVHDSTGMRDLPGSYIAVPHLTHEAAQVRESFKNFFVSTQPSQEVVDSQWNFQPFIHY